MLSPPEWQILGFSLAAAGGSTLLILAPGIVLSWWLARFHWPGKSVVETLVSLPLVMPPVATGFLLLRLLGRRGPFGSWLESLGIDVVFTWKAVVLAMAVMSFPLLVRTLRPAFEAVEPRLEQIARTLGAGGLRVFFTITLPLAARGVASGALLAFARALGEFGATVIVAGNIPGKTTTASVEIFHLIQLGKDAEALRLMGAMVVASFALLWLHEGWLRKPRLRR